MNNFLKTLLVATSVTVCASAVSAAVVEIDFSTPFSGKTYTEDGFTFTSSKNSGINLATCPPTGKCLKFRNNETITVTYSGGSFDLIDLYFLGTSNDDAYSMTASNGDTDQFGETLSGNDMARREFPTKFNNVESITWSQVLNGTGRIDTIRFNVAAVPVPAAGLLLVGALGALGLVRRRRTA